MRESTVRRPRSVDRGYAGRDIEPRKAKTGVPTPSHRAEGNMGQERYRKRLGRPRVVEDPAHVYKSREQEPGDPTVWPWGKKKKNGIRGPRRESKRARRRCTNGGKSDGPIVPEMSPNKTRDASRAAEGAEERGLTKGNFGRAKQAPDTEPGRKGAKHGKL
jgi:hypothetical protein